MDDRTTRHAAVRRGTRNGYFETPKRGPKIRSSSVRAADRQPLRLSVYLLGHCAIPARTVDLSANGVLVEIDADAGLGCNLGTLAQRIRTLGCDGLRLDFRDLAVHVAAETIRVTSGAAGELRAAFRFTEPVPPTLQRLLQRG